MLAPNYDENNVPQYYLPDPLVFSDGTPVKTREQWFDQRRGELLSLFEHHVYGTMPGKSDDLTQTITSEETALSGKALRRQITLQCAQQKDTPQIHILMYVPVDMDEAIPAFLALNFRGNHSIQPDPGIHLYPQWVKHPESEDVLLYHPQDIERGSSASRWPVETILERGYGLITAHYYDLDPDYDDDFQNGVHRLFPRDDRGGNAWGAISAWAWGLRRIMDYLETDSAIDNARVAVMGHSRLGKTALWAGATDQRFAVVISNESGCGGAALSRRQYGETVEAINTRFPHWFCTNFKAYNNHENHLPVDQHELIALIAPRPVYIASAVDDRWSDPLGEFLSAKHAHPVFKLASTSGLPAMSHPPLNQAVMGQIGYHIRSGAHDVTAYDWTQFMNFTDMHFAR